MEDIYQDFWAGYLEQAGLPENTYCNHYTYFGNSQEESVEILEQLLRGEKTAISHCVPYYIVTRTPMPKAGDYTMVTDFYGNPCCVLKCVDVVIDPVDQIPEDIARQECQGEFPQWLERKRAEFRASAQKAKFHYNDGLPVLMELVKVMFPAK